MRPRYLCRAALLFALAIAAIAAPPEILKVEPPNWWAGHSINPVRVMIRGRNLAGARVEAVRVGVTPGLTAVNAAGSYLFADLAIDSSASPGAYPLRVVTHEGAAEAPFTINAPLPREGRFQGFSSDDVIYLIMPDRFANGDPSNDDPPVSRGLYDRSKARYYHGGDFQGIVDHLPYLKDLGVTAIWMNPIYDNVNHLNERETYNNQAITDYHGYGAVDFYGVEEHLGTMEKLREMVDAAHRLGIKVIQDEVANHTGPYHPWVKDPPTPTWYNGTAAKHLANTWQTWTLADPHATPEMQKATLEGWFIDILPDLNQNDPECVRYLIQNTLWWIGMAGFDGIRQDTLPYVPRRFWRDWMAAIKHEYPGVRVIGEMFDGDPALVSFFQGGRPGFDGIDTGVDAVFDFPVFFPLRRAFAEGKPLRELVLMVGHDRLYPNPSQLVTFLGLHDVARFMNEPGASAGRLAQAFTFLMTARGIPLIYYGDEIGMPGGNDPDNRRDFPGGWKGDSRNGFEPSGRTPEQQALFEHVRKLAGIRARLEPLRRGTMVSLEADEQTWAYARVNGSDSVVVIFNNGTKPSVIDCGVQELGLPDGTLLEDQLGAGKAIRVEAGRIQALVPAASSAIYARKTAP
jgi:glycosidase